VLTDARGRLLQIVPRKPSLIGKPVAFDYAHLRSALSGTAAVSRVVPAAVDGAAIVGFATPFDTPQGRRVFSGGFDVDRSPIAAYLSSVTPIRPNVVDLVDPDGTVIASNRGAQARGLPPVKPAAGRAVDRRVLVDGRAFNVSERRSPARRGGSWCPCRRRASTRRSPQPDAGSRGAAWRSSCSPRCWWRVSSRGC